MRGPIAANDIGRKGLRFPVFIPAALNVPKTTIVPLTSDKGLCGGINSTVVKYTKIVDKLAADDGANVSLDSLIQPKRLRAKQMR